MARFVVIREEDADERLIEESAIPKESVLHGVLMSHPSLVPATDLGLGRVAAVGFEASLASGSADLVLLDDAGRLCIVEVKKEGNSDTRKVVAQLLDYAAALWGLTLEEFEREVVRDQDGNPLDLRELVREELVSEAEDSEAALEKLLEDLALTLRTGDFELVVAAPTIPEGVQRVMEYLNNQGQRLFGLEVSYFAAEGQVEAFVPRLVVRPSLGTTGGGSGPASREPIDQETYIESLPEGARGPVEAFINRSVEAQYGRVEWAKYGAKVQVRGPRGFRVIVSLDTERLWLQVAELKGIPHEPAIRAAERLREVGAEVDESWGQISWSSQPDQIEAVLRIGEDLVTDLSRAIADKKTIAS